VTPQRYTGGGVARVRGRGIVGTYMSGHQDIEHSQDDGKDQSKLAKLAEILLF